MNDQKKTDKDAIDDKLFVTEEKEYGDKYKSHLLEQYKLCVLMADKVSSRRSLANNFFLSLNTLLITIIGILTRLGPSFTAFNFWWVVIASIAGILFCLCWHVTIRYYRELNEAKFTVINSIEKKLPVAAFDAEWEYLTTGKKTLKYPHLTKVERWVPLVFALLYSVLMIIAFLLANEAFFQRLFDP